LKSLIVLSGFLGSGKTTFLKTYLSRNTNKKNAIIVNDFGAVNADEALLKSFGMPLSAITNGSIFCACKTADFVHAIETHVDSAKTIIVESSGFADPSSLMTLLEDLKTRFERIIHLVFVDATNLHKVVKTCEAVKKQLKCADIVLVTKKDIAQIDDTTIYEIIREYNQDAMIYHAIFGDYDSSMFSVLAEEKKKKSMPHTFDLSLKKHTVHFVDTPNEDKLAIFCQMLVSITYRIKGILNGNFIEYIDSTLKEVAIEPKSTNPNCLVLLSNDATFTIDAIKKALESQGLKGIIS
jgi:G3E family GTPase